MGGEVRAMSPTGGLSVMNRTHRYQPMLISNRYCSRRRSNPVESCYFLHWVYCLSFVGIDHFRLWTRLNLLVLPRLNHRPTEQRCWKEFRLDPLVLFLYHFCSHSVVLEYLWRFDSGLQGCGPELQPRTPVEEAKMTARWRWP